MLQQKGEVPAEIVDSIKQVLETLNAIADKLEGQLMARVKAAAGMLASVIGYGEKDKVKESLSEGEVTIVTEQLSILTEVLSDEVLAEAKIPADVVKALKDLIKRIYKILKDAGYYYGKDYYGKGYYGTGDETVYKPPKPATKESMTVLPTRFVEPARLIEAVEGTEGLEWEIECIQAGLSANKKNYAPEVLRAALNKFEGIQSYADHPSAADLKSGFERSIKDLAGWVTDVRWDPNGGQNGQGAIVGIYHALKSGPIADLLKEAWERNKPDLVQFSILGEGRQRIQRDNEGNLFYHVEAIDNLFSLDAVTRGAAGGRVRALVASVGKEAEELETIENLTLEDLQALRPDLFQMLRASEPTEAASVKSITTPTIEESSPVQPMPEPAKVIEPSEPAWQREKEALEATMTELKEETHRLTLINRERFLNEQLGSAELPGPIKEQIRKKYQGQIYQESDLVEEIAENVRVWADVLREQPKVRTLEVGPSEVDKLLDAVEGMIAGVDINGVPRFHSVKEAYCTVTGKPFTISGREYVDSVMRESVNYASWMPNLREGTLRGSISWPLVFGTSMYRRLIKEYQVPIYDEWKLIVSDIGELKDMKQQVRERTGYYGTLPAVEKGGTYQSLSSPGEEEANFTPGKYGGLEDWTWEDALNDDLGALKKIPKKLALAAKVTLYQYIFNFLRDGTTTPTTYDNVNLFSSGHANIGTDALGTVGLTNAKIAMRSQAALSSGATYLAIQPKYLVVPNELETLADILYNSETYVPATIDSTSNVVVSNPHKGKYQPIVVDYWTAATRWFLVADPQFVPTIEVGFLDGQEEPELFSLAENTGSNFSADKVVWKIRHVYGAAVLDHRGLYTSAP